MSRLALIGVGRWGSNIKRTLESLGVEVVVVEKGEVLDPASPSFRDAQGVLIATPAATHVAIALPFIRRGIPLFIEKPLATSWREAQQLERAANQARQRGHAAILFVGHIHVYNPAYQKAKELIHAAGSVQDVWLEGMNWGPERRDISAWWDWAPHDLALLLDLFGRPRALQAWGNADGTVARLEYQSFEAGIHVTWLSPQKRKRLTVVGSRYAVVFDDTAPQKVQLYREGDTTYPSYPATAPLTAELNAFLQAIQTGKEFPTDLRQGVDVVRLLAAGEQSMKAHGRPVVLRWP